LKKIIFIGPPNAGKTSLRKFLFDGVSADKILEKPELPTIGTPYLHYEYVYSYPFETVEVKPEKTPVELFILDTSGQELEKILTTDTRNKVFWKADIILFIFDVSQWEDEARRQYLMDFISFVNDARIELAPESTYHVIGHKYDLYPASIEDMDNVKAAIKNELNDYLFQKTETIFVFDILLTSLIKEYQHESFRTLFDLTTEILSTQ